MIKTSIVVAGVFCALMLGELSSAQTGTIGSTVHDGGSVVTDLGHNIKVNKGSELHRQWVVLNDTSAPAQLETTGVTTTYGNRDYSFKPVGAVRASAAMSALEVRYLLYDVFGQHMKTLSASKITEFAPGSKADLAEFGSWRAWENEVSEFLTAAAFVAQARTKDGKVWRYDEKNISAELSRIRLQVSKGTLEPNKAAAQ